MNPDQMRLLSLSADIRAIPDKLFAVQLDLRSLCQKDASNVADDAKATIADACARLHSIIGDLSEIVKHVDAWQAMGDGAWKTQVGTTSRMGPMPADRRRSEDLQT